MTLPDQSMPAASADLRRRVPVKASINNPVRIVPPGEGRTLPVTVVCSSRGVDLHAWAATHRDELQRLLAVHGGVLFRGFVIQEESGFQQFIESVSGNPLPYVERSSPRSKVQGNIYTSTEHPPSQSIFLHCENSYQKTWPLKIFFYCHTQPEHGGETPIADTRRILERIDPKIRDAFAARGVMYVRNFGNGLGLSWQEVFQTDDPKAVEEYCDEAGLQCVWRDNDRLTTRHVRKAIQTHPLTNENVWFNHAAFFHVSTLDLETQKAMRAVLSEDELPNNTYYGDGSIIEPEVLDRVRAAYAEETVTFPWLKGDLLMLDNMLAAHGRCPYRGARKILVGMTEPYSG